MGNACHLVSRYFVGDGSREDQEVSVRQLRILQKLDWEAIGYRMYIGKRGVADVADGPAVPTEARETDRDG